MQLRATSLLVLGVVLTVVGAPADAHANRLWHAVGGACVAADEDIQVNNYDTRGHGVGFKGVATGDIRLLCSVSTPQNSIYRKFVMSYKDTDGMSTASRIRATLRWVSDGSNASAALCTSDSNTSTTTGPTTLTCDFFDFTTLGFESYYFEIVIERTSSLQDPEFLAISLFDNN